MLLRARLWLPRARQVGASACARLPPPLMMRGLAGKRGGGRGGGGGEEGGDVVRRLTGTAVVRRVGPRTAVEMIVPLSLMPRLRVFRGEQEEEEKDQATSEAEAEEMTEVEREKVEIVKMATSTEAQQFAEEVGMALTLLRFSGRSATPLCRLFPRKSKEERKKEAEERKSRKKAARVQVKVKEMSAIVGITKNDFEIKMRKVRRFLRKGYLTKCSAYAKKRTAAPDVRGTPRQLMSHMVRSVEDVCASVQDVTPEGLQHRAVFSLFTPVRGDAVNLKVQRLAREGHIFTADEKTGQVLQVVPDDEWELDSFDFDDE